MNCLICGEPFTFEWTDLHGEGTCFQCGTPYQIIQYDEQKNRVKDAQPIINVSAEYIPRLLQYWSETHAPMGLGCFLGPPKYPERRRKFYDWLGEHYPAKPSS